MGFSVKTDFDPDNGIFIKYYYGNIELEDIFDSWRETIRKKKIPENVRKFIINYKKASINFPPERVSDIAKFYNEHDAVFGNARIAMVMESPGQVVFPNLIVLEKISFKIETFYTMEAAVNWLANMP